MRIGHYIIQEEIGRRETGVVYRAEDGRHRRPVALKLLPSELARHAPRLARFERDARTGALLNHPNIAAVYEVGCEEGVPYVASEWLNGTTLRRRMQAGLSPVDALRIARDIATGLAAAHALGVAHGDLNPKTIFVTSDGRAKIVDFGQAKPWMESLELLQAQESAGVSRQTLLATLAYLSPEQVRGREADQWSDIFSVGVILYEMLAGRVPFRGRTTIETLFAILHDEPRWVNAADSAAGRHLDRVLRRCLQKDAAARFGSASDLAQSLELVEEDELMVGRPMPPSSMAPRWPAAASQRARGAA